MSFKVFNLIAVVYIVVFFILKWLIEDSIIDFILSLSLGAYGAFCGVLIAKKLIEKK